MKLKKSEISEIIKEVLEEENIKINKQDMEKLHKGEIISKNGNEIEYVDEDDVEEGITGGLAGALLAKPHGGPGRPDLGLDAVLKMAAGGYFGSKIQNALKKKKEDK
jgi:outer membrane lipoprotein SlyB